MKIISQKRILLRKGIYEKLPTLQVEIIKYVENCK